MKVDAAKDAALIACSSGTTGLAKGKYTLRFIKMICFFIRMFFFFDLGIRLSHNALLAGFYKYDLTVMDDVMLCFSTLYWSSGYITLLNGTLTGATRIITTDAFSPELMLHLIEKYKVTYLANSPYHVNQVLKSDRFETTDISSLRTVAVGGSTIPLYMKSMLCPRMPNGNMVSCYGMGEMGCPLTLENPTIQDKNTCGRLLIGACVKIIDENGKRCGLNEDGEIHMKMNDFECLGYLNNPEANAKLLDAEGFMVTGDIGHFDEDGLLYITGRQKEFIRYGHHPIITSTIDSLLMKSPEIKAACAVGIPDKFKGELPAAVVIRTENSKISEKDVFDMVAGNFNPHNPTLSQFMI